MSTLADLLQHCTFNTALQAEPVAAMAPIYTPFSMQAAP